MPANLICPDCRRPAKRLHKWADGGTMCDPCVRTEAGTDDPAELARESPALERAGHPAYQGTSQ